jgi:eukaryotic-like serine/threonine-protein kinase
MRFTRLIGAGGMGEVWEARNSDLPGQRFAVKVVALAHTQNPDVVARFFGEARAAGAIDDPNIVSIHGTGRTDDGRPALVMPYIDGQSLADICDDRGRLPLDMVAKILLQIASALRAAHSCNIVHRDIKLQNVMVTKRWGRDCFVILVDFGICKFHDAALAREIHTHTKQYVGTPGYSAPEQILGKRVDAKADMYSLGVLAYRLLCGQAPYVADNSMELMNLQLTDAPFDEPRRLRPDIPSELNELIMLCLQRDPARRPNASQFGKWTAAGLRNGASLLASLAPRIATETHTSASDATISSDVTTALSQIQAITRHRRNRFSTVATLLAGLSIGVVSTGIVTALASRTHTSSPVEAPTIVRNAALPAKPDATATEPRTRPNTGATTTPPALHDGATDKPPELTTRRPSPVPAENAMAPGNGKPSASRVQPDVATERARTPPQSTSSPPPTRTPRTQGTLVLESKSWADCYLVDSGVDVFLGTAPKTVELPVGSHRIRCKNDQRQGETVTVMVTAGKQVSVQNDW